MLFVYLLAITGLTLSAVAIYYSVIGLTSIFAAAFWPIVIMGATLETAKLVAASWLKMYWSEIPKTMKIYMTTAVVVLMLITSMGIFGFLSKAHLDQNLVSGDVQSRIALIDEKIKIERENIVNAQTVIKQMDAAVSGVIATGDQEIKLRDGSTQIRSAAERSLQIRRSQARDRENLTKQIEESQTRIVKLQEEAAPIRAEMREVEAKVGPIKYIAALIYGDNPDANVLEKAVTWVILIIVFVFDPLAVLLILGAQMTWQWRKEKQQELLYEMPSDIMDMKESVKNEPEPVDTGYVHGPWPFKVNDNLQEPLDKDSDKPTESANDDIKYQVIEDADDEEFDVKEHARNHVPKKEEEEKDIVDTIGIDDWNKMVAEAERAVEEEKEKERMRLWKEQNPDSTIKEEQLKKAVGVIDEVPWNKVEDDPSKKKTTYMIKDHNKQIKKTKD